MPPAASEAPRPFPAFAVAAMILIWGYSWVVMKIGLEYSHPLDFAALRVAVGCVTLFALMRWRGMRLGLPHYGMAIVIGMLQVGLFVILTNYALMQSGAGKTSVLVYTMPFWLLLFAQVLIDERMTVAQWVAAAAAFVGLVLIVQPWQLASLVGSALAVAAGALWALCAVLSKKWRTAADPLVFTAWQLLFGLVALSIVAWIHPHAPVRWTGEFIAALAFSGVLGTAGGWWLWTYVLSRTSAGVAGLNSLGIPVVAVLSSAVHLNERPPALELAGMVTIGSALGLLAWLGLRSRDAAKAQ